MTRPDPTMVGNVVALVVRETRTPIARAFGRDDMGRAADAARNAVLLASPDTRAIATLAGLDASDEGFLLTVSTEASLSVDQWRALLAPSLASHGIEGQWDSATVSDFAQESDAIPRISP